jgi:hypothetical protein
MVPDGLHGDDIFVERWRLRRIPGYWRVPDLGQNYRLLHDTGLREPVVTGLDIH